MVGEIIDIYRSKADSGEIDINLHDKSDITRVNDLINRIGNQIDEVSNIRFSIIINEEKSFLLYRFEDYDGNTCKGGRVVEGSIIDTVEKLLYDIIKCNYMLSKLNEIIENIRTSNGILLRVKFKWGSYKETSVAYWDYTTVVIKLSDQSIDELTSNYSDKEEENLEFLSELTKDFSWSSNIIDFLKEYNNYNIAIKLKSCITASIQKVLVENMLTQSNIQELIKKNSGKLTTQHIKSVFILPELGLFAAILLWDIDYENKRVSIEILDDKVLDIENGRFVSDYSLYSRIRQKILSSSDCVSF